MTARPACALLAADPADAPALAEIERRSYSHPWSQSAFEQAVVDSRVRVLVLRAPHQPSDRLRGILAYCVLQVVADEAQIHNLAVRESARRRGLARRLLGLCLELARRRGAREVYLEVRASNAPAIALYTAWGLRVSGTRRDYYESPREDALVMRRSLESLNWPISRANVVSTALKA